MCVLESVDGSDVRMIQRSEHPRLALEASPAFWVGVERARQDLDCHVASQLGVVGTKNFAHSTGSEFRCHAVRADVPSNQVIARGLVYEHVRESGRCLEEIRRWVLCEQSLNVVAQVNVSRAGVEQKGVAGFRFVPKCLVIQLEDLSPAVVGHGNAGTTLILRQPHRLGRSCRANDATDSRRLCTGASSRQASGPGDAP